MEQQWRGKNCSNLEPPASVKESLDTLSESIKIYNRYLERLAQQFDGKIIVCKQIITFAVL